MGEHTSILDEHNKIILVDLYDVLFGDQSEIDTLLAMAGKPPGRMIEAGCGTGRVLLEFAHHGWEAVGFDFDPRVLAIAAKKLAQNSAYISAAPTVLLRQGDMRHDWPGQDTDVAVLASSTLLLPFQPERDLLTFNGVEIDFLSGENNEWKLNSFQIPIGIVKFPAKGAPGSMPIGARNRVRIDIDVGNEPLGEELWCTSIDWGTLNFKAMSPVVMVHGNSSDGAFFDLHDFVEALNSGGLLNDFSINFVPNATTVAVNAAKLKSVLPPIVNSFGVDSIHLVAHSKGGLDTREFLAKHSRDLSFAILSLTTLSTPHNGSIAADVIINYRNALAKNAKVDFVDFPGLADKVISLTPTNPGYPNLTTSFASSFNAQNLPQLPKTTIYNTIAADADRNNNDKIDILPEWQALLLDSAALAALSPAKQERIVNTAYQVLLTTSRVTMTCRRRTGFFGGTKLVCTITAVQAGLPIPNDTMVTIPSGMGQTADLMGFGALVQNSMAFMGANGKNHSSVAEADVAAVVIGWLIQAERAIGDLR